MGNWSRDVPNDFKEKVDNYSIFKEDYVPEESFGCYSLTITKALQDQYKETFPDTGVLKGQGNYQCVVDEM